MSRVNNSVCMHNNVCHFLAIAHARKALCEGVYIHYTLGEVIFYNVTIVYILCMCV